MGIIAIMLAANIIVMVLSAYQDLKKKMSTMIKKCKHKKATEEQNRKRELQREAMQKVKSSNGQIKPTTSSESFTGIESMDEREFFD
jgi:TRAP-type C4-dicarboxylate transport system substrate-binding protein